MASVASYSAHDPDIVDAEIVGATIVDPVIVGGKLVGGRIVDGKILGTTNARARRTDAESIELEVIAALGLGLVALVTYLV